MSLSKEIFAVMAEHRAHLIERQEFVGQKQKQYQAHATKCRREGSETVAEVFERTFVRYCSEDLRDTEKLLEVLGLLQEHVLELTQAYEEAEEATYAKHG